MQGENQPDASRLARLISRQAEKRHLASVWATRAGLAPGMTVLDIGAGTGALTLEYASMIGARGLVFAIDPDAESLAHAASEAKRLGVNVQTLHGTADALPALPRTPDRVMLTDSLHHMKDPLAALHAIHNAMKPGSRLFIAEYDPDGPGVFGAPLQRRIGCAAVTELLTQSGFACRTVEPAPDEHYTILADP